MDNNVIINIKKLGFPWETQDPFLFCVHHEDHYPAGNNEMGPAASLVGRNLGQDFIPREGWRMYHGTRVPGFPAHPHRGFETVTIALNGFIDHADSMGAAGRFGQGDVQWMTAGKGVQHSEMFPLLNKDKDNPLELFQIWLNLPKAKKFIEPHFKMLWADTIPRYYVNDENNKSTQVTLIAGNIEDQKAPLPAPNSWAADPENEVAIWKIQMEAGARWELPRASEFVNRSLYFFKGNSLEINGSELSPYHAVEVYANKNLKIKNGPAESHLLMLQGKPIDEPVIQYGPFVMNTNEEIQEAMQDYQKDQFGGWPWPSSDPVHPADQGRFAKHANGDFEERE